MFHKLAAKHLPFPEALREAIRKRDVAVGFARDGTIAYTIARNCRNEGEVRKAIEMRKRWELLVAAAEGVLYVIIVLAAAMVLAK
jgi:hypothetical protein